VEAALKQSFPVDKEEYVDVYEETLKEAYEQRNREKYKKY